MFRFGCRVILLLVGFSCCAATAVRAQTPGLEGRWQIEVVFPNSRTHKIQFDALGTGVGTFLLLDDVSNLNPPAQLNKAAWSSRTASNFAVTGELEFPIGNVGIDAGMLQFEGAMTAADTLAGSVTFSNKIAGKATKTGTFTAQRVETPLLRLLSLNKGKKVKRGQLVVIEWQFEGAAVIRQQQLSLSLDGGESFTPLSPVLEGDSTRYEWVVAPTHPRSKQVILRITVIDEGSSVTTDLCDKLFRIK